MVGGFNVVDFMNLPAIERSVVRLIMRNVSVTYSQLCEVIAALPAEQQIDRSHLNNALAHLIRTRWLIQQVNEGHVVYRVNTAGRSGVQSQDTRNSLEQEKQPPPSNVPAPAPSASHGTKRVLPSKIWDSLIESSDQKPSDPPVTSKSSRRSSPFNKLISDDEQKP